DDSQGEAFPTVSGLEAGQDKENIIQTSALAHDSTPRVNSLDADEGTQDLEISSLKARIKLLEDRDKGTTELSRGDAPIKGRSLEAEEEACVERSTKRGCNDTEEMVNVLISMDATNILTSRVLAVSVPPVGEIPTVGVPTGSGLVPTVSAIVTTASVVTPYSRRKGKEKMIARDAEIARIHVEEELQMMINGLDRNNKMIAKHLHEYKQAAAELTIGEKIELINELVKYQDHHAKILKYQAQQSKPPSKKQQREFYMSVLRSHSGWKTKHFKGMTLEEIKEKFIPVWKKIKDFMLMALKKEGERFKRKGLRLEQGSAKKMKTSEEVSEEDLKEMMQLVPVEEFRIQQYLQHEHYALWEVIEFGDSYKVPTNTDPDNATTRKDDEQSGRTVTITTKDMQKKKNDVKARTTLLLSLPDEHQLRFIKYKTAKELWAAILKTFGWNEATKKRKKNLLKQQYGNFKAEGSETLEQMFNRLQVIVSQLQFTDVEVKKDDFNQKFLTSLAPKWLMHTIVWRNRNDLDTMSLDDLYNHLKNISGNEDGNIACVSTTSTAFPTANASIATISQDTASAYIASQSNDKFWKRTGKKISIQGSDVVGFDKSKVECFNCHKMGHFARECRAPRSQERGRKENYRQGSKAKEKTPKALMAIDGVGWDWSYMANEGEDHTLVADAEASTEFALMANTESKLEELKLEKDGLDGKLAGLLKASNNLDNLIESQRSDKVKERVGYNAVSPPAADLYLSPKKDLSWTGLPEFVDDIVTDYSRPSPTIASTSAEGQNKDSSTSEDVASPNTPKLFVKFVKPKDSQSESKTDKQETPKKPQV
nr:hypothetical protein [Tanacetum cinerariifolium]